MTEDYREFRRLRAYELKGDGWKQKDIAAALGVTEGAVSQWLKRAAEGGRDSLRRRPSKGAPPRLSEAQRALLPHIIARGPETYGFSGIEWTAKRLGAVIRREFGVDYHRGHVSRIAASLGLNLAGTRTRSSLRDDEVIERWRGVRHDIGRSRT